MTEQKLSATVPLCMPSTQDLIDMINREGMGAFEKLTAGQTVRVQFALAIKHIAHALRLDPTSYSAAAIAQSLEADLEQAVQRLVMRDIARNERDIRDGERDRVRNEWRHWAIENGFAESSRPAPPL